MPIIKPTREELAIIRQTCEKACQKEGQKLKRIEVGKRCSLSKDVAASVNILLVDETKDWEDSDLFDFVDWNNFKKGFDATENGSAVVDFYCYDKEGLCTNAQAVFRDYRLVWAGILGRSGFTFFGDEIIQNTV